jgi:hypothetical protein
MLFSNGLSLPLLRAAAVLLEPGKDVLPSDYDSSSNAIIRDTAVRNRGVKQIKNFGASESKPALDLAARQHVARQHVSFFRRPISFFVSGHAHLLHVFSSLSILEEP